VTGDDIVIDLARAVPFGLLLNELVTFASVAGTNVEVRVPIAGRSR
jgi:hypothetical protein